MGMVSYPLRGEKKLLLDKGMIKKIIPLLEDMYKSNQDFLIILSGKEGAGKSTFARQLAWFCYYFLKKHKGEAYFDTESSKNIHFSAEGYVNSCLENKKFTINILDEARSVINRKRSTSKESVQFTNYLSEARDQNLVHIICLPSWLDLDRYVVQHRARAIIKIYGKIVEDKTAVSGRKLDLGYFHLWKMDDNVKKAYDKGGYEYPSNPIVKGEFKETEVMTEKGINSYNEKKKRNREAKYGTAKADPIKELIYKIWKNSDLTQLQMSKITGKSPATIQNYIAEMKVFNNNDY